MDSELRALLESCAEKLELYFKAHGPEYVGGIEYSELRRRLSRLLEQREAVPVAWLYTLEYGDHVAQTRVSQYQLNYPFGVCGSDYLASNDDGVSYVRQTPLYATPPRDVPENRTDWPSDVDFLADVMPDWTTVQFANGKNYAFNRATGRIYRIPHPECPFVVFNPAAAAPSGEVG